MLLLKAYRTPPEEEFLVTGGRGRAFRVYLGQFLTVADRAGGQAGDLFAFNAHDSREFLSPHNTRFACDGLVPGVGARFVSNRRRCMLTLVRDTVRRHDLLLPACDASFYASRGLSGHRSCEENAAEALRELGISVSRLYDPVHLFVDLRVREDKGLVVGPRPSRGGDSVTFRAAMDLLCVVSAYPMEVEGRKVSDLQVRVHNQA
jgi:hypothetical protein